MKKLFAFVLTATMVLSLAACGETPATTTTSPATPTVTEVTKTTEAAPAGETYTISIAHGYTADHPVNVAVLKMAEDVEKATDGRVTFEVFPDAQLGNESVMTEMIQNGTLQMGIMSSSTISGFEPTLQAFDLPYLFANYDVAYAVMDGEAGDVVSENILKNAGMRNLAYWENDYRSFSNNIKPITCPEDLSGIKMRVPSMPMLTTWLEKIGCIPTTIPGNEIYSSLQQKIVDGQENGAIMTYLGGYYEELTYFSMTNHVYGGACCLINEAFWQSLPSDIQQVLADCAISARDFERETNASVRQDCVDKMEAAGIKINYLSDEEIAVFQESAKQVYPSIKETIGEDLYNLVLAKTEEASAK